MYIKWTDSRAWMLKWTYAAAKFDLAKLSFNTVML